MFILMLASPSQHSHPLTPDTAPHMIYFAVAQIASTRAMLFGVATRIEVRATETSEQPHTYARTTPHHPQYLL